VLHFAGIRTAAVLLGFQPGTIDGLFGDEAGGAPQRFAFASAVHPDVTADEIPWPGGLALDIPVSALSVALRPELRREVREYQAVRARGESDEGPLDGHRMLLICRVAVLLALLHGEAEVSDDHWTLAKELVVVSSRLRDHLAERVEWQAAEAARQREASTVRAQVRAATRVAEVDRVRRAADRIVRSVEKAGGTLRIGLAKNQLGVLRDVADEAVKVAVQDGRLSIEDCGGASGGGPRQVTVLVLRAEEEGAA
jgi:hypothetical protein